MILVVLAICGALAVHFMLGVHLGLSFFGFLVGWPLFGLLVTIDDDLPGGWSNPDGSSRPQWKEPFLWLQLGTGLLASIGAFLVEARWPTFVGTPWLGAMVALVSYSALIRASARQQKADSAQ